MLHNPDLVDAEMLRKVTKLKPYACVLDLNLHIFFFWLVQASSNFFSYSKISYMTTYDFPLNHIL